MDAITIKNRNFKFKVPDPIGGCMIFDMLVTHKAPFGADDVLGLKSVKRSMTPDELKTFIGLCLKNCVEELPGGDAAVMDESGNLGIIGATSPLLTKLTAQYIVFFIAYWQADERSTSDPGQPVMPSQSQQT